jgi:endonuclease/exonuclease/phosphatase family metal-dependent hydrolase
MVPLLIAAIVMLGIIIMAMVAMLCCLAGAIFRTRDITGGGDANVQQILDSLPSSIRPLVKLSPAAREVRPSPGFLDAIGRGKELAELEQALEQGCIHDKSILSQCRKEAAEGFEVRVAPKGMRIYKALPGFITEDRVAEYLSRHGDTPSWFGNKYFCYVLAGNQWWGLISFRLEAELRLLDLFVPSNIARIIEIARERKDRFPAHWPAEKFIEILRATTGYQVTPAEQLSTIHKYNPSWSVLGLTPSPALPKYTHVYCNPPKVDGLNPTLSIKENFTNDKILMEYVLGGYPGIDGVIRDSIRSVVEEGGVLSNEEVVVKGAAQKSKMVFDYDDPLCWPNWKLSELTIPADGFSLYSRIFSPDDRMPPNSDFKLIRFYLDNPPELVGLPGHQHLLSFNVHAFRSLNGDISQEKTVADILALIKRYANKLTTLILQEVVWKEGVVHKGQLLGQLKSAGFPFIHIARNGAPERRKPSPNELFLVVASRGPAHGSVVDTTVRQVDADASPRRLTYDEWDPESTRIARPTMREQIVFQSNGLKVAAVHLEIGHRLKLEPEKNLLIREINSNLRRHQLDKLLKREPDILIGDFNFTAEDAETSYLAERGYDRVGDSETKSTPYNRVDQVFVLRTKRERLGANTLMRCNYSDHLPMFQAFT